MSAPLPLRHARGFTLVEMMVVIAMSAVVTLGIVSFYLSAQAMWTDASAQAVAQRDGTTLLDAIGQKARGAASAIIQTGPVDPANSMLLLYDARVPPREIARFFWSGADSLVHYAYDSETTGDYDQGPVVLSKVVRFHCSRIDSIGLVSVDSLRLRSASGQDVTLSSSYGLSNRP